MEEYKFIPTDKDNDYFIITTGYNPVKYIKDNKIPFTPGISKSRPSKIFTRELKKQGFKRPVSLSTPHGTEIIYPYSALKAVLNAE